MDAGLMPAWRGFHHIALVTPDLDATIQFYRDVLGMQISEIYESGIGVQGRHCFIKPGSGETWGLHVFEHPDPTLSQLLEKSRRMIVETNWRPGTFEGILQHIAFALPDEQAALALRARLAEHQVRFSPINEIGPLHNFLFLDNHGFLLEAAWPKPAPRPLKDEQKRNS